MQGYLCPFDESVMSEIEVPFTVTLKGVALNVKGILRCKCTICGAQLVPIDMVRQNTRRVADVKRAHLGMLSGAEIARIRETILSLSRHAASLRFGLGRNAFYKYEEEGALQSKPTDNLLRVLLHSPGAISAIGSHTPLETNIAAFSTTSLTANASTRLPIARTKGTPYLRVVK